MSDLSKYADYPAFFNVNDFAEFAGTTVSHIQHAARNSAEPHETKNRAKLPEGWKALRFGNMYVVYAEQDHEKMVNLFGKQA